jgi:hypothetical protein
MVAKIKPAVPSKRITGSITKKTFRAFHKGISILPVVCHNTPPDHLSNSPIDIAYIGQIAGIKITGISHSPVYLKFLLLLLLAVIINTINGIMVNAGIFVKIARPKNIPESKISKILLLLLSRKALLLLAKAFV